MRKKDIKKLICTGLAASMLPAFGPLVSAQDVRFVHIKGIGEAFCTLSGAYEYDKNAALSYEWLAADSADGSYLPTGETGQSFYVSQEYEDKWIKFSVSDGENTYQSDALKIGPEWGKHNGIDNETAKFSTVNETTPSEYVFTVGGVRYILLDVTESDESKFLVMTDKTVGSRAFALSKTNMFNDMAAFLNNKSELLVYVKGKETAPTVADYTSGGYIGNADYVQLADVILENINNEHIWKIEERAMTGRPEGERAVKAGIVLPSVTEMEKYCVRAGLYDANGFWYRTPSSVNTGGAYSASAARVNTGKASDTNFDSILGIRPIFYLDKSFFIDARLPVSQLGSAVVNDMKKAYSKYELSGVYTEDELVNVFGYSDGASIESIDLLDREGNLIFDISGEERLSARVSISNGNEDFAGELYAAVYTGGDRLKGVFKKPFEIRRNSRADLELDIENQSPAAGDRLKIFVWNRRLAPIAKDYEHSGDFSVRTEGIYETKMTIAAAVDGMEYTDFKYQWYISDSEADGYSPLEGKTEKDLTLESEYGGKWIKVRVSIENGGYKESPPRKIGERWPRTSNTSLSGRTSPDKDNMFRIDGQEFILLDKFESDKNRYLVICEEPVASRVYSESGGQNPAAVMEWLNSAEFENAGYLPQPIFRHLDKNGVWKVEPFAYYNNDGASVAETTVTGGISLPAVSEVKKYIDKLTVLKEGGWWTRTPYAASFGGDGNTVLGSSPESDHNGTFYPYYSKDDVLGIRPIFYLDRDFFTQEMIDLDSIGKNVREILISDYKPEEFSAYSQEEREILLNLGYVEARLEHVMDSASGSIAIPFYAETDEEHKYTFELTADGEVAARAELNLNADRAENTVEIVGSYDTNTPLKIKNPDGFRDIAWYVSDSYSAGYELIENETGETFIPPQEMSGKWIKASVTDGQSTYESEPVVLNERWRGKNQGVPNGGEVENAEKTDMIKSAEIGETFDNTPEKYIFTVGGQEFILLDTFNDEESKFLVMSREAIGQRTITTNGQIPADIMCWLNNKQSIEVLTNGESEFIAGAEDYTKTGYLNGGEGFVTLPDEIIGGINYDAYWKQEPKMYGGDVERVYRAGISIPAVTEFERYCDRIGWKDSGTQYTWTRTGNANRGDGEQMLSYNTDWGRGTFYPNTAYKKEGGCSFGIRPVFYLKGDFFLNNPISLSGTGAEVRNAIISAYSAEQLLSAGYDAAEVTRYCGGASGLSGDVYYLAVPLENGIYDMTLTVKLDGTTVSQDSKTVCYMPEYRPQFMDFYSSKGYCDSLSSEWAYDYAIKSGVKMMRIGQEWHGIEKEKGVYDFSDLDRRVAQFTEDGVELVFLMAYGNPLYSDTIKTGPANKEAIDAFAKCLAAVAERYPEIKYFEVYNEPNLNGFWQPSENHRDYTYLLQVCSREMAKARPDAKIAGGVLADGGAGWLANMLGKNAYPYMNVSSFHPYIYWGKNRVDTIYQSKLDGFMNQILLYGGFKENIITEVGWPSFNPEHKNGCTPETQALETTKQFIFAESNGINRIMGYNFINSGYKYDDPEHNFGIVTKDGIPKPAYLANAVMRNMTAGGVFVGEITFGSGDISHGYLYHKNGEPLLVLWKDFPRNADETDIGGEVVFEGESLTVYDMAGNIKQTVTDTVKLGSGIVYVEGLSDRWYKAAVAEDYEATLSRKLQAVGMEEYSSYFDIAAGMISELPDTLLSEAEAKELFDSHFEIAGDIIEDYNQGILDISQRSLSSLLDIVYETGIFAANYYMAAADEEDCAAPDAEAAALENAAAGIKAKEDTETGGYLPYSNAILEIAENHLDMAKRVLAEAENNPNKPGFVKSRSALAGRLIEIAEAFSQIETLTYDDLVLHAPTEQVKLADQEPGTVEFSIYNYDDKPLEGAELVLADYYGAELARSGVSLAAGESKKILLDVVVGSEQLSGGYGYAYLKLGDKILQEVSVKLLV